MLVRWIGRKKKKLPANDVSRYIDESFLRLCLSYRVGPVYPTVLIELSSRRLSASAVCSCPRMQRSRPVKGNATIATQKSRTLILVNVFASVVRLLLFLSLSLSISLCYLASLSIRQRSDRISRRREESSSFCDRPTLTPTHRLSSFCPLIVSIKF